MFFYDLDPSNLVSVVGRSHHYQVPRDDSKNRKERETEKVSESELGNFIEENNTKYGLKSEQHFSENTKYTKYITQYTNAL